jgi:Ni,Fe-hydrogenase maturation factor
VEASLHELSLKASLRFAAEPVTDSIIMIGVEPGRIDYSLELTPELQAAVPRVVAVAQRIISQWLNQEQPGEQSPDLAALAAKVLHEPA